MSNKSLRGSLLLLLGAMIWGAAFVAQRVGTVLNADRILVMDGGRLVGIGTLRELLESCPLYREIVVTQLSEDALKEVSAE